MHPRNRMKSFVNGLVQVIVLSTTVSVHCVSQTNDFDCTSIITSISGIFQGKNLFFAITEKNSIQTILLNDVPIINLPTNDQFELNLSSIEIDSSYTITIEYCDTGKAPYNLVHPNSKK
jgi:hypothetical protein